MRKLYRVFIPPPKYEKRCYSYEMIYTLEEICEKAGYKLKVTGCLTPKIILAEKENTIAFDREGNPIYIVDVRGIDLSRPEGWEMILETLAYGFMDYATRETVRHRP